MYCCFCGTHQPESNIHCSSCSKQLPVVPRNEDNILQEPQRLSDNKHGSKEDDTAAKKRKVNTSGMQTGSPKVSKEDDTAAKKRKVNTSGMQTGSPKGINLPNNGSELREENEQASTSIHEPVAEYEHILPRQEIGYSKGRNARKKRSYCREDKAFPEDEQKILNSYEVIESKTRENIMKTYRIFNNIITEDCTTSEISYIKKKLTDLDEKISLDPLYIGLIGSTGAGKSSLLNAVVKKKFFLPVSGHSACTSSVTAIKNDCRAKAYKANIDLLTQAEWDQELKRLCELCSKQKGDNDDDEDDDEDEDEADDDNEDENDDDDEVTDAQNKIKAVYGEAALNKTYEEVKKMKRISSDGINKDCITVSETDEKELHKKLHPYIKAVSDWNEKNGLWPLVKHVDVTIPQSDVLPEGVIFLDIPGTGDANKERDEMWRKNINKCSAIWIISSFERAMEKRCESQILNESINAIVAGMCSDITVIVTKSDLINVDEFNRDLRQEESPAKDEHEAIIRSNNDMKKKQGEKIMKRLKKKLPSDQEMLQKSDLVYTVSAREYWKHEDGKATHLTAEETEIPKLRDYIRKMFMEQKKKMLQDYVKECFGILSLMQIINSEGNIQEMGYNYRDLDIFLENELKFLENRISIKFKEMDQPLERGVKDAQKLYASNRDAVLFTSKGNNQGFHRKLRAICRNKGVHVTTTYRYDLNASLAEPMYRRICDVFRNKFRTGYETRTTLKSDLTAFKTDIKEHINSVLTANKTDKRKSEKCDVLMKMIDAILVGIQRHISEEKKAIYDSLWISIQDDLTPSYAEAACVSGKNSCTKMQDILKDATDCLAEDMFHKAKQEMMNKFSKLKDDIIRQLREEISNTLKLVLCYHEADNIKLPDVREQYEQVEEMYCSLM